MMPSTRPSASDSMVSYSGPSAGASTSWYGVPTSARLAPSTICVMNRALTWGISRPSR